MTKGLKFFLISFFVTFFGVFALNVFQRNLENYFYAQISQPFQQIPEIKIQPKSQKLNLDLRAKSAISVLINSRGGERVLFKKNADERLSIASLTKLMTADVILENYDLFREIKISEEAVAQEGEFGKLKAGRFFSVGYLLYPLLMESSNDAAYVLTNDYNGMTEKKFVELMNSKAKELGLENTYFINPTGLDPGGFDDALNCSTAEDLVKFTKSLLKKTSIWEILATPKFDLYGPELINTNELLGKIPNVVGGKTGYTPEAGGCMLLVLKNGEENFLINVILGAPSPLARIEEMEKLVEWLNL